jgi:hypothetical protein
VSTCARRATPETSSPRSSCMRWWVIQDLNLRLVCLSPRPLSKVAVPEPRVRGSLVGPPRAVLRPSKTACRRPFVTQRHHRAPKFRVTKSHLPRAFRLPASKKGTVRRPYRVLFRFVRPRAVAAL